MKKNEKINFFVDELKKLYPDAKTELYYTNNFQLLIAIIMSAQSTDKQVNKVNKIFFNYLKSPQDGVALGIENIKNYIKTISFYNNKAKYIYNTSKIILEDYEGEIPETLNQLIKLPGVGIKTSKVFLANTKDAPYIGVDTHVHRVLNRIGFVKTKTPLETDKLLGKIFDNSSMNALHNSIVLFGRYHCTARKPKCFDCNFIKICTYYNKN